MRYTFLVVDDTRFMRMMLTSILQENGYEVVGEADNGRTAIELYGQLKPDVTMMDITMSGINGIEAMKEIRRINPQAVVLICSAMSQQDLIGTALDAGADGYVVKPFKPDKVQSVINESAIPRLLKNRAVEDEAGAAEKAAASGKGKAVEEPEAAAPGAEPGIFLSREAAASAEGVSAAVAAVSETLTISSEEREADLRLIQEQLMEGLKPDASLETVLNESEPPVLVITEEERRLLLQDEAAPQDAAVTEVETQPEAHGAAVPAASEAPDEAMEAETADKRGEATAETADEVEVTQQQAAVDVKAVIEGVAPTEPLAENASAPESAPTAATVSASDRAAQPAIESAPEIVSSAASDPTSELAPASDTAPAVLAPASESTSESTSEPASERTPAPASERASEPAPVQVAALASEPAPVQATAYGPTQIERRAHPAFPPRGFTHRAEAAVGDAAAVSAETASISAQSPSNRRETRQDGRDGNGLSLLNSLHLCNWREERDGDPAGYAVEVSPGENTLILEMTDGANEKTTIVMSLDGFRQLSRWVDKIGGGSE